ncbi:uncharacterized protein LOC116136803 [Pistacia vera]|uniref:uncharacterized protein LOC116136803 n=1 Tax=Pistacia vera TaxID=55513 RepID=UPI001263622E|nr:uncharacterized protein LOC116136803 [Pistacia vera]
MESASEIMIHLQELYGENSVVKQYELCSTLFTMRLREELAPDDHVMKISNIIGQLHTLEIVMPYSLEVNLILQSLPPSFKPFIKNYNLNRIERTLGELSNEIQQFYKQGRKENGQDDIFAASSSKTKNKQWKQKKGAKVGPRKRPFKKDSSKTEKAKKRSMIKANVSTARKMDIRRGIVLFI